MEEKPDIKDEPSDVLGLGKGAHASSTSNGSGDGEEFKPKTEETDGKPSINAGDLFRSDSPPPPPENKPPPPRSPIASSSSTTPHSHTRPSSPSSRRPTMTSRQSKRKSPPPPPRTCLDLPTAWDEAHETFEVLEKCVYEMKGLGLSREQDEMMVCDCVYDKREYCLRVRGTGYGGKHKTLSTGVPQERGLSRGAKLGTGASVLDVWRAQPSLLHICQCLLALHFSWLREIRWQSVIGQRAKHVCNKGGIENIADATQTTQMRSSAAFTLTVSTVRSLSNV